MADHKRGKRESYSALRKLEKGEAGARSKKKAKVLVEVMHAWRKEVV